MVYFENDLRGLGFRGLGFRGSGGFPNNSHHSEKSPNKQPFDCAATSGFWAALGPTVLAPRATFQTGACQRGRLCAGSMGQA